MGVAGAAYATVIAQGVAGLLCLIYTSKKFPMLKLEKKHFIAGTKHFVNHLKIGIPMALQFSIPVPSEIPNLYSASYYHTS